MSIKTISAQARNHSYISEIYKGDGVVVLDDGETWSGINDASVYFLNPALKPEGVKRPDGEFAFPTYVVGELKIDFLLDFYLKHQYQAQI